MAHLRQLEQLTLEENPLKAVPKALKESDIPVIRDNPEIKAAEAIEPTFCEQITEMVWNAWSCLVGSAKALFRWLCG